MKKRVTYKESGVNIEAGEKAVKLIKPYVKSTFAPQVLSELGGFAGLFSFEKDKYKEPVLVAATDGVGTKLKIAQALNSHSTVGIDLVAMCVNDLLTSGAQPLFFLDYIACGKLIPERIAQIVKGIADGCRLAGCSLLGGETAEMPDFYGEDEYDLAGFAVGVVEKKKIIDGSEIREGDIVLGIASSGLHSNGYSLVRKIIKENNLSLKEKPQELGQEISQELMTPTRVYSFPLLKVIESCRIHGIAHITGGGLSLNLPRLLKSELSFFIKLSAWKPPPIFSFLQKLGNLDLNEMLRTFNMGIGLALVLPLEEVKRAQRILKESGQKSFEIGIVKKGNKGVVYQR